MEIHQIVVSASPGDAVTNTAFAFQKLLGRIGPSNLFARYVDPRLAQTVRPLTAYETEAKPDGLLIYHMSIGEPEVVGFLLARPERLLLVYHNITPSEYFAEFDPAFAGLLSGGRSELNVLRDRADTALAVSGYNARELEALGFRDVRISPLPFDAGVLCATEPDPATLQALDQLDGPLVLSVGQLLPHKRPDLVLQAYHVLTTYLRPDAHLAMIGPARLEAYHQALQTFSSELNLNRAQMTGWLTPEQLAAYYSKADVFLTMSEHEGFCVPLLEAMSFDVPVVARACGAIPDTLGDAGLLLPPEEDPLLAAEVLAELLATDGLRAELTGRGRRRLAAFDVEAANATFLDHVLDVADGSRR